MANEIELFIGPPVRDRLEGGSPVRGRLKGGSPVRSRVEASAAIKSLLMRLKLPEGDVLAVDNVVFFNEDQVFFNDDPLIFDAA